MRRESDLTDSERMQIESILEIRKTRSKPDLIDPKTRAKMDRAQRQFLLVTFLSESEEKDQIAWEYLKHVAGVDPGKPTSLETAARMLNGIGPEPKRDVSSFYRELSKIAPGIFEQEDVRWLSRTDSHGEGGLEILSNMSFYRPSQVVAEFMDKNHGNK